MPRAGRRQRPGPAFLGLVALVLIAAVLIRLVLLGRQSYWVDELFSAEVSARSFRSMWQAGATEVHPPLYTALLWTWIRAGTADESWTRLFSTVCGLTAVVVTHRGLRVVGLCTHVRWALTVATAAGGTSMIYSLETRSYSLLLLGAVGLTAATLRAGLTIHGGVRIGNPLLVTWTGWGLLAATTHLFGAVLTAGAASVLAALALAHGRPGRRGGRQGRQRLQGRQVPALTWVLLAGTGCSLQAAWLAHGITRPGFAAGTGWIPAPDESDVWDLVTTTFSSGVLTPDRSGFAWTSPLGAVGVAALCVAALVHRLAYLCRARCSSRRRTLDRAGHPTAEGPAGAVLLGLVLVVAAPVFAVSQWMHLWTLRNMIVVAPALAWGAICVAASGWRTGRARNHLATAVVLLLGLSLVPTTIGLTRPYKTDFRGLFRELTAIRAQDPDAKFAFVGPAPLGWRTTDRDPEASAVWSTPYGRLVTAPAPGRSRAAEVTIVYRSVADPDPDVEPTVHRWGPRGCRQLPLYGLGLMLCPTTSGS